MARITLTADEEFMYLRELNKLQDMMPDLEIQVISEPAPYGIHSFQPQAATTHGEEFRAFLQRTQLVTQSQSQAAA